MIATRPAGLSCIGIVAALCFPLLAGQANGTRSIFRAQEFRDNPWLVAHARQTILLDNEPKPWEEPVIRYELGTGKHDFCLSGGRSTSTDMLLKETFGDQVFKMSGYEQCTKVDLQGGIYELRFSHVEQREPGVKQSLRIQVDPPSPPLADSNGNPAGGYWAIQPDPALDVQHRRGRLRAEPPFQDLLKDGSAYGPVVADFSSSVMDEYSLFHVINFNTFYEGAILQATNTYWSLVSAGFPFTVDYVLIGDSCGFIACSGSYTQSKVKDLGNYKFELYFADSPFFVSNGNYANDELTVAGSNKQPASFNVLFRFFPDGSQIGNINPGEAALLQTCGYKGRGAVFAYGSNNLTAVNSPATTIDNSAKSVRLGNNTAVRWNAASSPVVITSDTACLPDTAVPGGKDFEVLPLDVVLSDSATAALLDKKCINCKLRGTDLANLNFEGWNLSGADLSGATLDAKLHNVKLDGAILVGTKLPCVDFSGTDQNHPTDWTTVDFSKVEWVQTDGCKSNFSYTLLSVANFPTPMWKYANLSHATFVDAKGKHLSSAAHPLDLSGVTLAGVSLQGAVLDYATGLAGADLTQARLSGASLRHVDLSKGTKLNGAQFDNANLEGANLSGAILTKSGHVPAANLAGAFLKNVNLSQAQLSGANFTNSSFYSTNAVGTGTCLPDQTGFTNTCASAAGATINNTQFSDAYLFGVDFTRTQIQGVQFTNAVLAGANFAGATLSVDTNVGTNSGFSGALLQGTYLAAAKSLVGVSLAGAFLDFSPKGNTMYLKLGGQHTVFAGYWNTPGQSVCAEMTYNGPDPQQPFVPTTNETIICPNGNTYPKGCGPASIDGSNTAWKSPVDITQLASYQFDSTYTKAPPKGNAICSFDPTWSGAQTAEPKQGHRPHPVRR